MTKTGLAFMLINLGQYLESEHGKDYRFAVQNYLQREYKLSTYSSDYDDTGKFVSGLSYLSIDECNCCCHHFERMSLSEGLHTAHSIDCEHCKQS